MAGAGENFVFTGDNMPKLRDQPEQNNREMDDFENLKNHIEMTVTNEGLRIEFSESAAELSSKAVVPSSMQTGASY